MPKIFAIVLNYNIASYMIQCVQNVMPQKKSS